MSQFIYRVRPARSDFLAAPTRDEMACLDRHFAYLLERAREGVVLLAGRTLNEDESTFGIVLLEARSREEAEEIMRNDPAVRAGVFEAELFPYRIAIASPRVIELAPLL